MGRVDGWERRLLDAFKMWEGVPFAWGVTDCLHFCIDCERAIKGRTEFEGFPAYKTRSGGFKRMKKMGFDSIQDFLSCRLELIPAEMAQRGDWMQLPESVGQAFGVCAGKRIAVMGECGIAFFPAGMAVRAWRVT